MWGYSIKKIRPWLDLKLGSLVLPTKPQPLLTYTEQCGQMSILFFLYLTKYSNEHLPNSIKISQNRLKRFTKYLINPPGIAKDSIFVAIAVKFRQIWSHFLCNAFIISYDRWLAYAALHLPYATQVLQGLFFDQMKRCWFLAPLSRRLMWRISLERDPKSKTNLILSLSN